MTKKGYRTPKVTTRIIECVAAYIRVSTEDQAESGLGLAAQRSRCLAAAVSKGWPEPIFYEDAGISGTKDIHERPALSQLMKDIKAGKVHAVIVLCLDRLARKVRIALILSEEFRKYNVDLVSCKEAIDTSTPYGNFFFTVTAAFAELERDMISQRTTDALRERGKRDGEMGGRLPYGYQRTNYGIEIDPRKARTVRTVFFLRAQGVSLREIADVVSTESKQWRHSSIVEILKNKDAYEGGKRGDSNVCWPAILQQGTAE